jgi:hypothetical protein
MLKHLQILAIYSGDMYFFALPSGKKHAAYALCFIHPHRVLRCLAE